MAVVDWRKLKKALLKKGFQCFDGHHKRFVLFVDDCQSPVWTKLSHITGRI